MDSLITAAARALAAGDLLGVLKRVALRDDPPALALRGIAMAQLGDFARAKTLLLARFVQLPLVRIVATFHRTALFSRNLGVLVAAGLPLTATLRMGHGNPTESAPGDGDTEGHDMTSHL